ncbi:MAG: putative ATP-dependent DNA helicase [Prokaryotic dsDNA virus sp.]|nr:MAG: putative ATP-dependent DNA helicase [Prokaryotic dsDNA virus sp.]|tara:strand:- start:16680 stop:17819 length:1140 start_codon:yes stop_codon:yes gene_type:complete
MTVTLSETQNAAVDAIMAWYKEPKPQEFYLAGYAGSGKSTLTEEAIKRLKDECGVKKVCTGAYTGKAAYVLRQKGAENAQTIHSMVYIAVEDEATGEVRFELNKDGPAGEADIIILDECSMIDEEMAKDIRSFEKKILVLGDPGQLPPVRGAGAFTSRKPDVFLHEIHRQAADSPIIKLATMARQGIPIKLGNYGPGVKVIPYDVAAGDYVYDENAQVICGLNKVRWSLTQKIRSRRGYTERKPEHGETIICCRNDRERGVFNGQQGVFLSSQMCPTEPMFDDMVFDLEGHKEHVEMTVHPYLFDQHFEGPIQRPRLQKSIGEFDWGYVLTCHKAQGSQWPRIAVIDDSRSFREDQRKWLYTAITRAEKELTLIVRNAA